MSCEKNRNQAGLASVANGIMGLANRWAGTMGSWSTWMGVTGLADIGKTAADVTTGMTGVSNPVGVAYLMGDLVFWLRDQKKRRANTSPGAGTEGKEGKERAEEEEKGKGETPPGSYPKIVSPIGAMIGLHTLEAATGAAGTTAMRLFMPGKPVGTWRNVVIRQDRSMPLKTKALSRATGGRVIGSSGYYFHEGGRTWMCASYTLNVNGTARTLAKASTLAYPKREYFFDRPLTLGNSQNNGTEAMGIGDDAQHRELPIQRVVDVVKGVTYPEQVPGYIGSTNELENIIPLGGIKRSLFAASWFLVDESERDTGGGIGYADYQAAMSNNGNSSTHIYRRLDGNRSRTGSGSTIADYSKESLLRYDPKTDQISVGDGKGNQVPIIAMANSTSAQPVPLQAVASRSSDTKSDTDDQLYYWGRKLTYAELSGGLIKHFVEDDNGIPRPLLLRNVIRNPLDNSVIPDAIYCDSERWRQVVDSSVLSDMAQNFQNGGIQKTLHWMGFVNGYEYPPPFGASQK